MDCRGRQVAPGQKNTGQMELPGLKGLHAVMSSNPGSAPVKQDTPDK